MLKASRKAIFSSCHSLTIAAKTLPTKSFNSLNEFDLSPLSPRVPPGTHPRPKALLRHEKPIIPVEYLDPVKCKANNFDPRKAN
ncbi:unnamed protein product [Rhizophagus irregularis]|nr:unnamed protein product [Rhizophagus irregularis]CAB5372876.1 unnamed protein product [Rhizophagus irregularis]